MCVRERECVCERESVCGRERDKKSERERGMKQKEIEIGTVELDVGRKRKEQSRQS